VPDLITLTHDPTPIGCCNENCLVKIMDLVLLHQQNPKPSSGSRMLIVALIGKYMRLLFVILLHLLRQMETIVLSFTESLTRANHEGIFGVVLTLDLFRILSGW
jgi:hypothetical protein